MKKIKKERHKNILQAGKQLNIKRRSKKDRKKEKNKETIKQERKKTSRKQFKKLTCRFEFCLSRALHNNVTTCWSMKRGSKVFSSQGM